ncbi:MAG: M23 family metallopeptidase [Clostridia bacterium]|nr:M23 family metallopeptidase [Clostridia bacterium]
MKKQNKVLTFMRKNAIYLILTACILAVGLSVTLMLINQNSQGGVKVENPPVIETPVPDQPDDEQNQGTITPDNPEDTTPVQKPITFIMPVANSTSVAGYSETMVWCSTLSRYQAHLAIDFFANEGEDVFAVYDGKIESVESTLLHGITVTIDHGNGLKTVYNSLADGDEVFVGQTVAQGEKIGEVSVSNRQEYKDGAHLHFEVIENGNTIDPVKYLAFEEK